MAPWPAPPTTRLDQAKIGVLSASTCAAMIGYLLLRMTLAPVDAAARPGRSP